MESRVCLKLEVSLIGIALIVSLSSCGGSGAALSALDTGTTTSTSSSADTTAPSISSVVATADSTYASGDDLDFSLNFSEAVTVTGTPRIALTVSGSTYYANYSAGSETSTLTFRYTVSAATSSDWDGIDMASPIELNGGTIKDAAGNDSALTFTAPNTSAVLVRASWTQEAYIKAVNNDGATTNDLFGSSVSLSSDTLAVGTYQEDSNQTTITNGTTASADNSISSSGAVYVYKRTGTNWAQEAYIKAVNNDGAVTSDSFGTSVSLSSDTLAVGVYQEDSNQTTITNGTTASADNTNTGSGAVYIYRNL